MTNNSNKVRATIATVKIGHLEFEGLYAAEIDTLGIAIPQIVEIFSVPRNRSLKQLNALWGTDFQSLQWRTSLNSKAVNVLLLPDFERLIFELVLKQNKTAIEVSRQLIGLSLTQLFSDAFNIHFEKEHRQLWLKARQEGKIMRRELTDAIADYLARTPTLSENYRVYIYGNVTNILYKGLFARNAQELKACWGIQKKQETPREKMTPEELTKIQGLEDLTARLIDSGSEPMQAANEAITRLIFPVIER